MRSFDKTLGERMAGPQQTVSGKLQATVEQASQQARTMDQQRGYSKAATDVSTGNYHLMRLDLYLIISLVLFESHELIMGTASQSILHSDGKASDGYTRRS